MAEVAQIKSEDSAETWQALDKAMQSGEGFELVSDEPETEQTDTLDNGEPETETVESDEVEAEPVKAETPVDDTVNYDLDIPLPDHAEPVKLGELKDRFVDYQRRETELQKREAEISSEYGELARLNAEMQANQGPLNPEQRQRVGQMQVERLQREAALMSKAIPEWTDPARFQSDRQEMVDMMKPYGVTEDMINGISDHRVALFYKHHLDMRRRIAKAEAAAPEPAKVSKRPKGRRPGKTSSQARTDKLIQHAKASNSEDVKLAAIGSLLGEK